MNHSDHKTIFILIYLWGILTPKSSEAWIYIAMIHRMARFSLPEKNRDDDLLKRPPKLLKA